MTSAQQFSISPPRIPPNEDELKIIEGVRKDNPNLLEAFRVNHLFYNVLPVIDGVEVSKLEQMYYWFNPKYETEETPEVILIFHR